MNSLLTRRSLIAGAFALLAASGLRAQVPMTGAGLAKPVSGGTLKVGLISFWEMSNTSWTDSVVATGNDLTGNNAPTSANTAPTLVGNYVQFVAASSQTLTHASNASLQTAGTDFSIAFWVYRDSAGDMDLALKAAGGGGNQEWNIAAVNDGAGHRIPQFGVWNSSSSQVAVSATTSNPLGLGTGAWHFISCTYTLATGVITISVDGGTRDTVSSGITITNTTQPFSISGSFAANFYDGRIDQFGFWKKALTTSEEAQLYNSGGGLSYAAM